MEVLLSSSPGARHGLLIERGPLADHYFRVQYHVCVNPVCRCEHIGMRCFSGANSPSGFQPSAPIVLDLDLRRRVIANLKELKPDRTAFSLAKAIEDEISDGQWAEIRELYFAEKRRQTENADLDQVEVRFPPEVLQGDGSMVGYYELFPYARQIVATLDATPWILDDQYCVNPTCRCRDVGISFLQGHSSLVQDDGRNEVEITIRYAYDKGEITESLAAKASGPFPQDLFHLMKEAQPDLDTIFAKRHALIRRLFRRATADTSPRVLIKKPGRNDPCPCGSGKKYKRCCGMVV
jgi:hypothetical protein